MNCKHQFLKSADASKMKGESSAEHRSGFIQGIIAVCVLCGEVRKVFEDGTIVVVVLGDPNWAQKK